MTNEEEEEQIISNIQIRVKTINECDSAANAGLRVSEIKQRFADMLKNENASKKAIVAANSLPLPNKIKPNENFVKLLTQNTEKRVAKIKAASSPLPPPQNRFIETESSIDKTAGPLVVVRPSESVTQIVEKHAAVVETKCSNNLDEEEKNLRKMLNFDIKSSFKSKLAAAAATATATTATDKSCLNTYTRANTTISSVINQTTTSTSEISVKENEEVLDRSEQSTAVNTVNEHHQQASSLTITTSTQQQQQQQEKPIECFHQSSSIEFLKLLNLESIVEQQQQQQQSQRNTFIKSAFDKLYTFFTAKDKDNCNLILKCIELFGDKFIHVLFWKTSDDSNGQNYWLNLLKNEIVSINKLSEELKLDLEIVINEIQETNRISSANTKSLNK